MDMTLTVLDTAGIQSYIFNSNELRENIGASHLVHLATTHWVEDALDEVKVEHNYQGCQYDKDFRIEEKRNVSCAEVLYAGGGNTYILFGGGDHETKARDFVYTLSKWVIEKAPGLNLYAAHEAFTWGQANLSRTTKCAVEALAQLKNQISVYQPTLGLSVTAACTSTGLPANGEHPDPDKNGRLNNGRATLANRANRQVMAQWHAARHDDKKNNGADMDATDRLRGLFDFVKEDEFKWTDDLDKIGKLPDRDENYIAVVHADGNGMGKRMQDLAAFFSEGIYDSCPRAYITAVRCLSTSYQETALKAFKRTICDLVYSLKFHEKEGDKKRYYPVTQERKGGKWESYFPFRPIVFGGDDVTWVCTAPWGLPLAQRYLEYLEEEKLPDGATLLKDLPADMEKIKPAQELQSKLTLSEPPYACAGISIVKTHYPISRAYHNSEELCKSAKRQVLLYEPRKQASAIDWHITATGLAGTLTEIRQREYQTAESDPATTGEKYLLTMRPLMLKKEHTWRNWENFYSIYEQFDKHQWFQARNKAMALREALRQGPTTVAEFERAERLGSKLPQVMQRGLPDGRLKAQVIHGWMNWGKSDREQIEKLLQKPINGTRSQEQELVEVRCAYFDAIEMEGQILRLKRCPEMEEETT